MNTKILAVGLHFNPKLHSWLQIEPRTFEEDGTPKTWAIFDGTACMSKLTGNFQHEPRPSNRTDGYFQEYRFGTVQEAVDSFLKFYPDLRPAPEVEEFVAMGKSGNPTEYNIVSRLTALMPDRTIQLSQAETSEFYLQVLNPSDSGRNQQLECLFTEKTFISVMAMGLLMCAAKGYTDTGFFSRLMEDSKTEIEYTGDLESTLEAFFGQFKNSEANA